MTYLTAQGTRVEYPFALAAKAARLGNDDINEIVSSSYKIFTCLQNADYELITLREENKRLKYENEFMLRLINEKET